MSNGKRRADAPGVLASTLDGAGWEFESQQDVEQGAEKRPRTKPECFEAGAAPPPSALHAAHRAKAAEEAAEEEAAEEEAAVNARPAEGARWRWRWDSYGWEESYGPQDGYEPQHGHVGSREVTGNRAATTSRSRSAHAALTTVKPGVWRVGSIP